MKRISHFAVTAGLFLAAAAVFAAESTLTPDEARGLTKEAYIFGYPLVENYRTMFYYAVDKASREYKGPFNAVVHMGRPYTPQDSIASPNNDTVSSFAWLDLRREPVVLTVPKIDKTRYFSITLVDLYTFNFASIGTRQGSNAGGRFLITGPSWKGKTPGGITLTYACETDFALAVYRNQLLGAGDLANLGKIQDTFSIEPLSQFLKKPAPPRPAQAMFPTFARSRPDGVDFIRYLNFVLQYCKVHPSETKLMERLARIGVGPGQAFDAQMLPPEMMIAMEAGIGDAVAELDAARTNLRTLYKLFGSRAAIGGNYFNRFLGAHIGLYTGDWEETLFIPTGADVTGRPLDGKGGAIYTLRFPPGKLPPASAFWSLSLYDGKTQSFAANLYNRYSINSTVPPAPVLDPDGGLTIRIQHDPPAKELEANWLPAPDGPFYLTMRLYWPKPAALEGKWTMPLPKKDVVVVAPVREIPFDPPFVKQAATPRPMATPVLSAGSVPFVRDESMPSEDTIPLDAPAPTPTPRATAAQFINPPFIEGSTPSPTATVQEAIPVRAALPVDKASTPVPKPRTIATPSVYNPPFVADPVPR